jgi:hypothetical protein
MRISPVIFTLIFTSVIHAERITILTQPIEQKTNEHWYHPAVTHSLLRGLQKLGVDFNFNPSNVSDIGSTVIVLTNIDALREAIQLKKTGLIKKLLAGPNLVGRPIDFQSIVTHPCIDMYLVNSSWTQKAYLEDAPSLMGRISSWPSGIDETYWVPQTSLHQRYSQKILIYKKYQSEEFYSVVKTLIKKHGFIPCTITYGSYTHEQYREALQQTLCAIFLSRSESQGLGLVEAWAMDVPTLVWDLGLPFSAYGRQYSEISACPYLTLFTGYSWKTLADLEKLLQKLEQQNLLQSCAPRQWVLEHMTDVKSAQMLMDVIENIGKK